MPSSLMLMLLYLCIVSSALQMAQSPADNEPLVVYAEDTNIWRFLFVFHWKPFMTDLFLYLDENRDATMVTSV